jgi:zinc/manganese transport system substrate-binding protein
MFTMRFHLSFLLIAGLFLAMTTTAGAEPLKVVTTSPDYASIVRYIGGNEVTVTHLIQGDQDPHQVRPKPSLAQRLAEADLLIATGLDLEMWLPGLIDKSGNEKIREGQPGYVSVSQGLELLDKPDSLDRSQGDVHLFGNPHFHTGPINAYHIARNVTIGLIKALPEKKALFKKNLERFEAQLDKRLFGEKLVALLGSKTLRKLAAKGNLISFLEKKSYQGGTLIDLLGGWYKKAMPLRGLKLVSYHKNWAYLSHAFGLNFIAEVEPKPGIPPSARDVADLVEQMRQEGVKLVFAANYFDESKVQRICEKVGARAVIVPLSVGGAPGIDDYFSLVDLWVERLLTAHKQLQGE